MLILTTLTEFVFQSRANPLPVSVLSLH